MGLSRKIMVWDPGNVKWEDDSFASGWTWYDHQAVDYDGDYMEATRAGLYAYGRKSVPQYSTSNYPYLVVHCSKCNAFLWRVKLLLSGVVKWSAVHSSDKTGIKVYDVLSSYNGNIDEIELGLDGSSGQKCEWDFTCVISAQPIFPEDVISARVRQGEDRCDEFEVEMDDKNQQYANTFTPGRSIRIILGRGNNKEKVFAGIIEEDTPDDERGDIRRVRGRSFQGKLLLRPKTKTFSDREVSLAVKDLVEDLGEVTTLNVETPSPAINVTKEFVDEYIADGLDELVKQPSLNSPYPIWEWKLGHGQDLRFRSRTSSNVPTCSTSLAAGTNVLKGVKKGYDVYLLKNKVVVIGGKVWEPENQDAWTDDHTDYTKVNCTMANDADNRKKGSYGIKVSVAAQLSWNAYRTFTEVDVSKFQRVRIWLKGFGDGHINEAVAIYLGKNSTNYYWMYVSPGSHSWTETVVDLNDPGWGSFGNPSWAEIGWFKIYYLWSGAGDYTGDMWFDGLHFETDNLKKTATDPSSPVAETREYVHPDEKLRRQDMIQQVADALLYNFKAAANRIEIPVIGAPDLQVGRKVNVNISKYGLSGEYYIVETEHIMNRRSGYTTKITLTRPSLSLPGVMRETLQKEVRRLQRGPMELL